MHGGGNVLYVVCVISTTQILTGKVEENILFLLYPSFEKESPDDVFKHSYKIFY